jgi:hypothetical protein
MDGNRRCSFGVFNFGNPRSDGRVERFGELASESEKLDNILQLDTGMLLQHSFWWRLRNTLAILWTSTRVIFMSQKLEDKIHLQMIC